MNIRTALLGAAVLLTSLPASGQEWMRDQRTGTPYGIRDAEPKQDSWNSPRSTSPSYAAPSSPRRVDLFTTDGMKRGSGTVDSDGRVIDDDTGRVLGKRRY